MIRLGINTWKVYLIHYLIVLFRVNKAIKNAKYRHFSLQKIHMNLKNPNNVLTSVIIHHLSTAFVLRKWECLLHIVLEKTDNFY